MTAVCPNGHQSATTDYCDQCGARIDGGSERVQPTAGPSPAAGPPPAEPSPAEPEAAKPAAATATTGQACPVCSAVRVGTDRYCEGCGYDFTAIPAVGEATAAKPDIVWEAVVTADRAYHERMAPEGIDFPPHCPARTFVIQGREVRIGRRSTSRGIQPEIDLGGAPEDTAISHLHALLVLQPDGSYALVDPGSTNGTTVNDDETPIAANVAVPISEGDRVHVGAWTTITFHTRPAP